MEKQKGNRQGLIEDVKRIMLGLEVKLLIKYSSLGLEVIRVVYEPRESIGELKLNIN